MVIRLTPSDTLFFRTGRPFTMGSESWADCFFPPLPRTLYGALRAFLIFQRGTLEEFYKGKYEEDLGTPKKKGAMVIRGPLLSREESLYFPVPRDLVVLKGGEEKLIPLDLQKLEREAFVSDWETECAPVYRGEGIAEEAEGWLEECSLQKYLQGSTGIKSLELRDERELFREEPKFGIARDRQTLTAREGYLYRIPMVRLEKGVALLLEVEGVRDFPKRGVLRLGGEGKVVFLESMQGSLRERLGSFWSSGECQDSETFKVYLATPAIFRRGYLPEWIGDDFKGEKERLKLKLLGAAVGKPFPVGGWDMSRNTPKEVHKAVPAGSVYYFRLLNGRWDEVIRTFHFQSISDIDPEEGFGLSLVGRVQGQ